MIYHAVTAFISGLVIGLFGSLLPGIHLDKILIGVIMLTVTDILCDLGKWESVKKKTPFPIRDLIYILMIFAIILFAGSGKNIAENFIYANF